MKKIILLIMSVAVFLMCAMPLCAESEAVLGDVNGDGFIDLRDVTAIMKYSAKWESQDDFIIDAADTNRDGTVNISDSARLMQYIAGWYKTLWGPYFP